MFSAYNSGALKLLTEALSEAMAAVQLSARSKSSRREQDAVSVRLAKSLMQAHDSGERDLRTLRDRALAEVH